MALAPRLCPGARIVTFMLGGLQEIGAVAAAAGFRGTEGAVAVFAGLEGVRARRGRRCGWREEFGEAVG
jgi:hypothetical protein